MEVNDFQIGSYVRPCDGEAVSGDAIVVKPLADGCFLSLIDVLGHGRAAAEVALIAIRYLKKCDSADVAAVLTGLNKELEGTRGAAVSMVHASSDGAITCTGIGNTVIRRVGGREQTYPAPDGIVGVRFRTPRINQLNLNSDELLLIHSDGLPENFPLPSASMLFTQPTDSLARRIVLDHGKSYDDAACIAMRYKP